MFWKLSHLNLGFVSDGPQGDASLDIRLPAADRDFGIFSVTDLGPAMLGQEETG